MKLSSLLWSVLQSSWAKWVLTSAAVGLYTLVFVILYQNMGPAIAALCVIPVSLIAWFFGLRAGVLAALLSFPLNTLLLNLLSEPSWDATIRRGGVPGTFAILMIALVIGHIRKLSDRLRESEEGAHQLSDAAFEAIAIHDQGIILEVNQSFCRMYGYERSEVIGKSALDLTSPEFRELVRQKIAAGDTRPYEGFALRKDGTTFRAELVGKPMTYRGRIVRVTAIRDVTESKQAQEKLEQERNLLMTLIANLPHRIFYKDAQGRYVLINNALARVYRLNTVDDAVGKSVFDFYPAALAAKYHAVDLAVIRSGQPIINNELDSLDEHGNNVWLLTNKVPVQDKRGQVTGLIGISIDITERKHAEQALRDSEAAEHEQRLLAEALRDSAAAINSTLNLEDMLERILVNVERVVPYDAANIMVLKDGLTQVVGSRGWAERGFANWADSARVSFNDIPNWQRLLGSHALQPFLVSDTDADPEWVTNPVTQWIRSTAKAPIHIGGQLIGILHLDSATPGFFTQKHLDRLEAFAHQAAVALHNAQLFQAEQRRRQIAETLVRAAAALNSTLELNEVLNVILQELHKVIDYQSASIQQLQHNELVLSACQGFEHPEAVIGLRFPLVPKFPNTRVITEKAHLAIEDIAMVYPHFQEQSEKYASARIRSWLGIPLLLKDRVLGMITLDRFEARAFAAEEIELATAFANQAALVMENVGLYEQTQRHAAELERRVKERTAQLEITNEELRVLSRVKDEFVSNVSHELHTPLASLNLRYYLLAKQPETLSQHLPVIQRETSRLTRIIDDLLTLSRIDQNRSIINLMVIDLNALVREVVADRRSLAEERGLNFIADVLQRTLPVQADPGLLEQVLSVLLTNALNYTPGGGQVVVSTQIGQLDDQPWASFSVRDTGPGIKKSEQATVFTRFFRGTVGRESGVPGTGLGLSIAKEIVDRHFGRIAVESEGVSGKGAMFNVWLPAILAEHE